MPPQTPGDDELETVQHPTLGQLKFPKTMPPEERQQSVDYLIRQKYGLPEGTNLHAQNPEEEAGRAGDRNKYTNAYYEANTKIAAPQRATRGYIPNLIEALPKGSPFTWPGYGQAKAAYDVSRESVRQLMASRARGEPWYKQAASAGAPLIGLSEPQVRRAGEAGDIPGILGAITPSLGYAAAPALLERAGGEAMPRVRGRGLPGEGGGGGAPGADLRPLPRPRGPTATETLDAATQRRFPGKTFGELDHSDQMEVMRGGAAGGPAEPTTIPPVPRGTPPRPGAPGGGVTLAPTPKPRPPGPGATPEETMFHELFGPQHEEAAQLAEWETGSREGKTPEPLFRMGEQMGLRVAKAPGLADVYIPKGMADAEIPGFVAQQHALERQMKPGLPGQPGQPGGGLPTTQGVPSVPGQPGLTPAPSGATITPAHGTRPAAPALQDLLRGWGGAEEGTLPPVRPEEPPPKK